MGSPLPSLDPKYEIRLGRESDRSSIIAFIDEHWRKGHILTTDQAFLDWQHFNSHSRTYNFILGVLRENGEIHGILGILPLSQFDKDLPFTSLISMAIWKVREDARGKMLGRHLMHYLETVLKPDAIFSIGPTAMSLPMYKQKGYQTGRLGQYFMLNPSMREFFLVANASPEHFSTKLPPSQKILVPFSESQILKSTELFSLLNLLPRKTPSYLINRYLRHPYYKYKTYAIKEASVFLGVIVTRVCSFKTARAIRVVDFIGRSEALAGLQKSWLKLMEEYEAEYIDFIQTGIEHKFLIDSGFLFRASGDHIVIPNHFEPFSRKNIEIDYAVFANSGVPYRIVKGDSDQDRPNLPKQLNATN